MDLMKAGALIRKLRLENVMTQRELAEKIGVAPKTISKWECAQGFPDVSLLGDLSGALGADIASLLNGERNEQEKDGGNMKKIRFYTCPACGNILTSTGSAEISCCGRKLEAMQPKPCDEAHTPSIEPMDGELYVHIPHAMSKEHFIRFVACVSMERVLLVRMYPEQEAEMRMPRMPYATWYIGCSQEELFVYRKK